MPAECGEQMGKLALGAVTRTLQNLLAEGVPIRDMRSVVEALADASGRTQDPEQLTALVRPRLGRLIVQGLLESREMLSVMTLEPGLEQLLHNTLQQSSAQAGVVLEPGLAERLFAALRDGARAVEEQGLPAVLVVSPGIRAWLARAVRHRIADLTVLAYSEIPDEQAVKVIQTVSTESSPSLR